MPDPFVYTGEDDNAVPKDVNHVIVDGSVRVIPKKAFFQCNELVEVELMVGVEVIGESAFEGCESLSRINLPEGLRVIERRAFKLCRDLQTFHFPTTLLSIGRGAFSTCDKLARAELPNGLQEIAEYAFERCSLEKISIPPLVGKLRSSTFACCWRLTEVNLPDSIQSIDSNGFTATFHACKFPAIRIPSLLGGIDIVGLFRCCHALLSLEVPESLEHVCSGESSSTYYLFPRHLRNVAIPRQGNFILSDRDQKTDLYKIFPSDTSVRDITEALQNRFVGRPIHKCCYYQSYYSVEDVLAQLRGLLEPQTQQAQPQNELNANANEQDVLGMNPIHILACSKRHDLRLYRYLLEKNQECVIASDKWGGVPLLYAIWSDAPQEVVRLLIDVHRISFPDHEFDWVDMIKTLSSVFSVITGKEVSILRPKVDTLLETQLKYFPQQAINWKEVFDDWFSKGEPFASFRLDALLQYDTSRRVGLLGVAKWQAEIANEAGRIYHTPGSEMQNYIKSLYAKLEWYEHVKEATTLLELALWKTKLDQHASTSDRENCQKRVRLEVPFSRSHCRVHSGAEVVIPRVIEYLLPYVSTWLNRKLV